MDEESEASAERELDKVTLIFFPGLKIPSTTIFKPLQICASHS